MANRIEMVWDREANTISVGNAVFTGYNNFKGWQQFAKCIAARNGLYSNIGYKDGNKQFADFFGCTPTKMYAHYQKMQYKAFVVPYKELLCKIGFSRRRINTDALYYIKKNHNLLLQAYKDGTHNILPLIAVTGMDSRQLKQKFKQQWKTLANNSLSKNRVICGNFKNSELRVEKFGEIADLPTTVIEHYAHYGTDVMQFLANNWRGRWKYQSDMRQQARLFIDTEIMAGQLGKTVNHKWSARRLKEEHDKMAAEIAAKRYSKDLLESTKDVKIKRLTHEGYVATLLDSAYLIGQEGEQMGHCVAGYIESVRRGSYLVYSITKDGEKSSTLGISIPAWQVSKSYVFNQHYKRFNYNVTDEHEKQIAELIIQKLNEQNTVQQEELVA